MSSLSAACDNGEGGGGHGAEGATTGSSGGLGGGGGGGAGDGGSGGAGDGGSGGAGDGGSGGAGDGGSGGTGDGGSGGAGDGGSAGAGDGGGGGGTGSVCEPGAQVPCYTGPPITADVGICRRGVATCSADGSELGACVDEVVPAPETCTDPADEDCDGQANEEGPGCVCVPGDAASCYTGPPGTAGVGTCKAGTKICDAHGTGYGPCSGEVLPTSDDCHTEADEDCDGVNDPCGDGEHLWSKSFGADLPQRATGVAIDAAGKVVVAGYFAASVGFGGNWLASAGGDDIFVSRLESSGAHIWSKRFGGAGDQRATAVAADASGNVLIVGTFDGTLDFASPGAVLTSSGGTDVFVAKLNASGAHVWSKRLGGAGDQRAVSVAVDSNLGVSVAGDFDGPLDVEGAALASAGGSDVFVTKLDGAGNVLWTQRFGDAEDQRAGAVAVDAAGNVLLTGELRGSADFGGGPRASAGGSDVFVAKLSAAGAHLWSQRFGGTGEERGKAIGAGGAGGAIVVAGDFEEAIDLGGGPLSSAGGKDIFAAQLDAAGGHVWSRRFGDASDQQVEAITVDGGGTSIITGSFEGTLVFGDRTLVSAGSTDVFAARLDALGNPNWSRRVGGAGAARAVSVARDVAGAALVAGEFSGELVVGTEVLTSANVDAFTLRLDAASTSVWGKRFGDDGLRVSARSAAADPSGNIVLGLFAFNAEIVLGPGNSPAIVAQFGPDGDALWQRSLATAVHWKVAASASGGVVAAGTFGGTIDLGGGPLTSTGGASIFVLKLDSAGTHVWSKAFSGSGQTFVEDVVVSPSGDVVLVGTHTRAIDFGGGPLAVAPGNDDEGNGYLVRLDAAGNHVFSRGFHEATSRVGMEVPTSVAVDGSGNVAVAGWFTATIDLGGVPQVATGVNAIFAAKFDPAGGHLWSKRFGGPDWQWGAVTTDGSGDLLLAGHLSGAIDFGGGTVPGEGSVFAAKLDGAGNHLWSKRFDSTGSVSKMVKPAIDAAGNILLMGNFGGSLDLGGGPLISTPSLRDMTPYDVFLAKLDPGGAHLWSRRFGDTLNQHPSGLAVDGAGNAICAGEFSGAIDLGGGALWPAGAEDVFLAKFSP
ncbi:hypothetical protein WMF30_43660 [Sorangium sp. So ce134]